jgi:hypothetical protein
MLPDPYHTGLKASNEELNLLLKSLSDARIIDGNEEMEEGEICIFFAVTPFGRSVRCLVVKEI